MLVIGHRGAAGHAIENTIPSIKKAIEIGVDFIEIDIQMTKDRQLVLFHDRTMHRLTGNKGYIWDYTYDELRAGIRVMGKEPIPRFEVVCELVAGSGAGLYVEAKQSGTESAILSILDKYFDTTRYAVGSFYHKILYDVKRLNPAVKTVALFEGAPMCTKAILESSRCDYVGLGLESIDPSQIDEVHSYGCGVFVWTVDELEEIRKMFSYNVEGLVSNYPERVIKARCFRESGKSE